MNSFVCIYGLVVVKLKCIAFIDPFTTTTTISHEGTKRNKIFFIRNQPKKLHKRMETNFFDEEEESKQGKKSNDYKSIRFFIVSLTGEQEYSKLV